MKLLQGTSDKFPAFPPCNIPLTSKGTVELSLSFTVVLVKSQKSLVDNDEVVSINTLSFVRYPLLVPFVAY